MSAPAARLRGLYAITPAWLCGEPARLRAAVDAAVTGGAVLVQYRDKDSDPATRRKLAGMLQALCRERGVPLVINDDLALAADLGAGVHLGRSDAAPDVARRTLGAEALVGVSCSASVDRAVEAEARGASYAAFGRFFPSRTKPQAPEAPLSVLGEARRRLRIPVCAIGGLDPDNAGEAISAGADLVAAVEGVFGAPDVAAAARAFARLFAA